MVYTQLKVFKKYKFFDILQNSVLAYSSEMEKRPAALDTLLVKATP